MTSPWIPAALAMFVWWFSTGAILLVVRHADRQGQQARTICVMASLPLLVAGAVGFWLTLGSQSVTGAYLGFLSALAIWGWIELAFLTGVITGPYARACPPERPFWDRFLRAWGTLAYHEMLLTATLAALLIVSRDAVNTVGLWTFLILYAARISAKLNLFLGVPEINTEFLPSSLAHLESHFTRARLNWLFPFSVTALTFAVACWLERLVSSNQPHDVVGFALLTAITGLALIEHWLMVLPLPDAKLWRWMLPSPNQKNQNATTGGTHEF